MVLAESASPRIRFAGPEAESLQPLLPAGEYESDAVADVEEVAAAEPVDCIVARHDGPESVAVRTAERVQATPLVAVVTEGTAPGAALAAGAADYVDEAAVADRPQLLRRRIEGLLEPDRDGDWYESLLESSTDVLSVLDEGGIVRYQSPSTESVLGYEPEELVGESGFEYIHEADRERVAERFDALLAEETAVVESVQYRVRDADGEWLWLESKGRNERDSAVGGYVISSRVIDERREHERRLEHFETLMDVMPDTVVITDTEGYQQEIHGFEGWSGYEPDELVGEHVSKTTPEDDLEKGAEIVGELIRNDGMDKATYETHIETKDGDVIPFENHITLLPPDEDGMIPGSMSVLRDISERKERERRLEQAETVFRNAQDAVFLLDVTDAGRLQYRRVNQSYERMTGLTDDEVRGRTPRDVFGDATGRRIEAKLRDCIDRREPIDFELECETPKLPDYLQTRLSPLVVEDEVEGIVGATRDVTERKEREAELRLKNRAMDEAPLGITIADATRPGRPIVYANDGFERLTGYDELGIRGRNLSALRGPETDEGRFGSVLSAADRLETATAEVLLSRKDGTPVWTRVSVAPVTDEDGEATHVVAFQQNITERKEYETEIERRFDEFSELLAGELGEPLSTARTRLASALEDLEDPDVEAAATSLERTERLLEDLTEVHSFAVPSRDVSEAAMLGTGDGD